MCLGLCPYLDEMGEHVAFLSDCTAPQGRCYAVCPRTETDLDSLRDSCLPSVPGDYVLGPHRTVWMARARKASGLTMLLGRCSMKLITFSNALRKYSS